MSVKENIPAIDMPLVSVLMPAFNVEKYIESAIESILNQSYLNFELIILDDGSIDQTRKLIDRYLDPRIKKIYHNQNMGLVLTRNQLVSRASGRYIAFLDADDIAMPERLQVQVNFLEADSADLCGTDHLTLNDISGKVKVSKQRYSDPDIRAMMTVCSPLCNPSVMGKAEIFKHFPYKADVDYAEDYCLWGQLALAGYRFANIDQNLLTYRLHQSQTSQLKNKISQKIFNSCRNDYLIGLGISDELVPRPMMWRKRLKIAPQFLFALNKKIPGISIAANYQIYSRFQPKGHPLWRPMTRFERAMLSIFASILGRF